MTPENTLKTPTMLAVEGVKQIQTTAKKLTKQHFG